MQSELSILIFKFDIIAISETARPIEHSANNKSEPEYINNVTFINNAVINKIPDIESHL